jgi:hypothetical protein
MANVMAASREWSLQVAAMLAAPASFKIAMARFRRVAMTRGPLAVRTWQASSL